MGLITADATGGGKDGRKDQLEYVSTINKKNDTKQVQQIAMCFGNNYHWAIPTSVSDLNLVDDDGRKTNNIEKAVTYTWLSPNTPPWKEPLQIKTIDENLLLISQADSSTSTVNDNNIVEQIACSAQATIFLTKSGKIYQQGTMHGHVTHQATMLSLPPTVAKATKIKQIVAGRHFALALPEHGNGVFSWGANHFGQLGIATMPEELFENNTTKLVVDRLKRIVYSDNPILIERCLFTEGDVEASPIVAIAAGDFHALALTTTGKVWAWGCNRNFQCGVELKTGSSIVANDASIKPSIVAALANSYGDINKSKLATVIVCPKLVVLPNGVSQIAAGGSHSIAVVSRTNEVYCWGKNQYGQCGNSDTYTNGLTPQPVVALTGIEIVQVSAGGNHTVALAKTGQVLSWGDHTQGQLGILNGSTIGCFTQSKPRRVQELDNDDLRKTNSSDVYLSCSDISDSSPPQSPVSKDDNSATARHQTSTEKKQVISKIVSVYAGRNYSAAVCESGYVYVWGSNDCGQLGIPTPKDSKDIPMLRDGCQIPRMPRKLNSRLSSGLPQSVIPPRNRQPAAKRQSVRNVRTFDSEHNILLPMHLDAVSHVHTQFLACGPTHMWIVGDARTFTNNNHPPLSYAKTQSHVEKVFRKDPDNVKSFLYNENIDIKKMQPKIL